jgi:hypothetical protein
MSEGHDPSCEWYCHGCAALRAEVERLRSDHEWQEERARNNAMAVDEELKALHAEVEKWMDYGISEHNVTIKLEADNARMKEAFELALTWAPRDRVDELRRRAKV